jgi:hypothetical protein
MRNRPDPNRGAVSLGRAVRNEGEGMMYIAQYRDVDDDRWQFLGEYPTKADAATAAYAMGDYPTYYSTRIHRINQSWQSQFPNNCPIIEVTGDGVEAGTCTYHLKGGVCPRHGEVREE